MKKVNDHEANKLMAKKYPHLRWQFLAKNRHGEDSSPYWQTLAPGKHPTWLPFMSYRIAPGQVVAGGVNIDAAHTKKEGEKIAYNGSGIDAPTQGDTAEAALLAVWEYLSYDHGINSELDIREGLSRREQRELLRVIRERVKE